MTTHSIHGDTHSTHDDRQSTHGNIHSTHGDTHNTHDDRQGNNSMLTSNLLLALSSFVASYDLYYYSKILLFDWLPLIGWIENLI